MPPKEIIGVDFKFLWIIGLVVVITAVFLFRRSRSRETGASGDQDAARFARLLIAQIKLTEPYKLERGIKMNDIYGSLKDEIDNARTAFRKRVPSERLEHHFDDQLVDVLASGDSLKMGAEYRDLHSRS
jgi:hypothetical protein